MIKPTILKETNVGYAPSSGATVPPAGDVARFCIYNDDGKLSVRPAADGYWCKRDDVNRLTAELVELLAEVERRGRCYTTEKNLRQQYQSELTKARELIHRNLRQFVVDECERTSYGNANARTVLEIVDAYLAATSIAHNVDESCGQDAEAAKGGA